MELRWKFGTKTGYEKDGQTPNTSLRDNFIRIDRTDEYQGIPEKPPTQDALAMCRALKSGKFPEYMLWLEQKPEKKIINKFCGIINSKSTGLPILDDEEMPPVAVGGYSYTPIQNIQARMMTKVVLLLLVESESKKIGVWNQLEPHWTEKYFLETKRYVQIIEKIIKQCENTPEENKIADLSKSIKLIKEANTQYSIDW